MSKARLMILGLGVVLLTVSFAYAQPPEEAQSDGAELKESIYKELNLTSEQEAQLEANRAVQRQKIAQLRSTIVEKEKQLQQILRDPQVVQGKVAPLVHEIKTLQAKLIDMRVKGIFAVKEILLPEQMAKLDQLMEKRKEDRKDRFPEK